MLMSIKGVYRAGKIELEERATAKDGTPVVVTFLSESSSKSAGQMMTPGKLVEPGRRMSTIEDFKDAEYDDSEWDRE